MQRKRKGRRKQKKEKRIDKIAETERILAIHEHGLANFKMW
jgi:hypothetical protein